MALPDLFETDRLRAERLTETDRADVGRMDTDPEFVARIGGVRTASVTDAYVETNLRHWTEYGFGVWILRDRMTGDLAGRALLRHVTVEGVDEVEIGYGLFPAFWGRGLATEIATALVRMAFEDLGLSSVIALTTPGHVRSLRVMTKAGLAYERDVTHADVPHVVFRATRPEPPDAS